MAEVVGRIYLSPRIAVFFIGDAFTVELAERRVWHSVSSGHPTLVLVNSHCFWVCSLVLKSGLVGSGDVFEAEKRA